MARLRARVQYASNPAPEAPVLLLEAARSLEPLDVNLARETYLDAWMASCAAGAHAPAGGLLPEVSRAARLAPPAREPVARCDLFLDGLAAVVTDGRAAGAASLRTAVDAFLGDEISDGELVEWGQLATHAACLLWDWRSWEILSATRVELARASGALAPLSIALNGRGVFAALCGDAEAAKTLVGEHQAVKEATGIGWHPACALLHAAYEGRPEAQGMMWASVVDCVERGLGQGSQCALWTTAILCNGLGRYEEALAAARLAADEPEVPVLLSGWALPELVEAAVRARRPEVARDAMQRLSETAIDGADWAAGIVARSRALVAEGPDAEQWYLEAVERFGCTPFRTELARSHLVYGEWLRRAGRRVDARRQLTRAYEMFVEMGAEGFGERARRELMATGEKVRKRHLGESTQTELTSQEEHVVRLAREGRSNAEIGAELFLSVRTVEWHLRKVFTKLGVSSRKDLQGAWGRRPSRSAPRSATEDRTTSAGERRFQSTHARPGGAPDGSVRQPRARRGRGESTGRSGGATPEPRALTR
jgi:DNA-binding CsgD family transcriptional regulator